MSNTPITLRSTLQMPPDICNHYRERNQLHLISRADYRPTDDNLVYRVFFETTYDEWKLRPGPIGGWGYTTHHIEGT